MGNPAFNFGDGGPCWTCQHFKGLRTDARNIGWVLCGRGLQGFQYSRADPDAGCKYWEALAGEESGEEKAQASTTQHSPP